MDGDPDLDKKDVRRPMNAFLIFCKRHRTMVRERNPHLDNRSVTRILGDLWANIGEEEKVQYTDLAKQYKDAFMRANPDYKWHNPERMNQSNQVPGVAKATTKPTNERPPTVGTCLSGDGNPIVLGKLADPSNMGGLSLLMEGNQVKNHQFMTSKEPDQTNKTVISPSTTGQPMYQWPTHQGLSIGVEKQLSVEEKTVKIEENLDAAQNLSVRQTSKMDNIGLSPNLPPAVQGNQDQCVDETDNSIYSCGKIVMDHIINKLYLSTFKNVEGNQTTMPPMDTGLKKQEPAEVLQKPQMSSAKFIPPSQGKKSYHTSIAVRNLLEFTRKAAAQQEEANIKSSTAGQMLLPKTETKFLSETKQRLKDFCLKKESRPKSQAVHPKPPESCEVKEYKRKRCYSESIAEFYKSQEKRIKIESDQYDKNGGEKMLKDEDCQPTRKSRRRNRGQKYQELINEGIIQPSKARLAAMKTDTGFKGINFKESFLGRRAEDLGDEVLSVYPRQIRKRTMSESEKNRTTFDVSARYRTGDFDLEAHIKTLPACSIDKVVKPKRTIGRTSSESEPCYFGLENSSSKSGAKEIKLTVPPHIKAKCSETGAPMVGSKKRKARKHSITHLQPVKTDTSTGVAATLLSGVIHQRLSTEKMVEEFLPVTKETCEKTETINRSCLSSSDEPVKSEQIKRDDAFCIYSKDKERLSCVDINVDNCDVKNKTFLKNFESEISFDYGKGEYDKSENKTENVSCKVEDDNCKADNSHNKVADAFCGTGNMSSATKGFDSKDIEESVTHSAENDDSDTHFTKLKECSCDELEDTDSCESDKGFENASLSCASSDEEKHTSDPDENLNETDFVCKIKTGSSATNVSDGGISDFSEELQNTFSDKENFTKVTAVSVAVPISEANQSSDREPGVLQVTVSSVSDCSSSVAITTMQPSLTCLC